jgi:hypothetical protein
MQTRVSQQRVVRSSRFRRNATLRASLALVFGLLAIVFFSVLFGSCVGWVALILPFVAAYVVFELFTVRESLDQTPELLWRGICPGCTYPLLRSGSTLAQALPDARTRAALSSHERVVRCSECGALWDLALASESTRDAALPGARE